MDEESDYNLDISDISQFRNNTQWTVYRQKTWLMALVIWVLIIYIAVIWIYRSLIRYDKYENSSTHLIIIDAVLVMLYIWFILPYHRTNMNKFTGKREMQRQLNKQKIDAAIDGSIEQMAQDAEDLESCNMKCCKDATIEFNKQINDKDILIAKLTRDNVDLTNRFFELTRTLEEYKTNARMTKFDMPKNKYTQQI